MADPITEDSLKTDETTEETTQSPAAPTSRSQEKRETIQKDAKMDNIIERAATDPNSLSDLDRENLLGWKRRKTIERLGKEKKIRMIIPFQVGEDKNNKANWYYPFGINGVFIHVRKGMYVEVPESIFILYQDSIREVTAEESLAAENATSNIDLKYDPVTNKHKSIDGLTG